MNGEKRRGRWYTVRRSRGLRGERGQAATELILVLPVFLALVFGLIELGKGFAYWVDMTHLAGEGGRYAAVSWFPGCAANSTGLCPAPNTTLAQYIASQTDTAELRSSSNSAEAAGCPNSPASTAKGEVPCKLRVEFCYPPQTGGVTKGTPGSALRVKITSTYRLSLVKASLGLIPGFAGLGDVKIGAGSTIRLERPIDTTRLGQATIPDC